MTEKFGETEKPHAVQDAAATQAEMAAFLAESREDMEAGRTFPARAFLEALGRQDFLRPDELTPPG